MTTIRRFFPVSDAAHILCWDVYPDGSVYRVSDDGKVEPSTATVEKLERNVKDGFFVEGSYEAESTPV